MKLDFLLMLYKCDSVIELRRYFSLYALTWLELNIFAFFAFLVLLLPQKILFKLSIVLGKIMYTFDTEKVWKEYPAERVQWKQSYAFEKYMNYCSQVEVCVCGFFVVCVFFLSYYQNLTLFEVYEIMVKIYSGVILDHS